MSPDPRPPAAARRPHPHLAHGDTRPDDFYWLADRDDPEVVAYLKAGNAYGDAVLAPTADLQARLFEGIRHRVVETDVTAPARHGGGWSWTVTAEGRQDHSYW
ncbi:MAG: oligopeptidase B, partial [Acidimicrobiales bacterium]